MGVGADAIARPRTAVIDQVRAGAVEPVVWLVALLVLFSRGLGLAANPTPWLDEAMLLVNLRAMDWPAVLRPMPFFEQSAPLGYVAMGKALAVAAGAWLPLVIRCLSAGASLAAAVIYYRTLAVARGRNEAALSACVLFLSAPLVFHAIEIKQYGFEVLATVAVMASAAHAARSDASRRSIALFILVGAVALLVSFSAALVVAGFGAALFADSLSRTPRSKGELVRIAGAGLLLAALGAAIYLGYSRGSVDMLLAGHAERYARGDLQFPPLNEAELTKWVRLFEVLENGYVPVLRGRVEAAVFLALAALGWIAAALSRERPTRFLALGGGLTVLAQFAAAVTGVFTPYAERHLLFMAPVTAFLFCNGLLVLVHLAAMQAPEALRRPLLLAAIWGLVLGYGLHGVRAAASPEREPLRTAFERVRAEGGWPAETWVDYAAQPAVEVLGYPTRADYLGRVSHRSVPTSWYADVRRAFGAEVARFEVEIASRNRVYLLYSHVGTAGGDGSHRAEVRRLLKTAHDGGLRCRLLESGRGLRGEAGLYRCDRPSEPPASP
jgi:hypothetical protein